MPKCKKCGKEGDVNSWMLCVGCTANLIAKIEDERFLSKREPIVIDWDQSFHLEDIPDDRCLKKITPFDAPKYHGDYAKTYFLSSFRKPSPIKKSSSYSYLFTDVYGISDPPSYHQELINEGYFTAASLEQVLSYMKIPELKTPLKEYGLKTSGTKDVLITRLLENTSPEQLEHYLPTFPIYVLSEKAKSFLDEHNDYLLLIQHNYGLHYEEYDMRKEKLKLSFSNIIWSYLNELLITSDSCGMNEYHTMSFFLKEEGNYSTALQVLLKSLYIGSSGAPNAYLVLDHFPKSYIKHEMLEYILDDISVANDLKDFNDIFPLALLDQTYKSVKLPFCICSRELFEDIVGAGLNNEFDEDHFKKPLAEDIARFVKSL